MFSHSFTVNQFVYLYLSTFKIVLPSPANYRVYLPLCQKQLENWIRYMEQLCPALNTGQCRLSTLRKWKPREVSPELEQLPVLRVLLVAGEEERAKADSPS